MFAKFEGIWPAKWAGQFADAEQLQRAHVEWSEGLAGLSADDFKRALELVRVRCEWPCSIAEFRRLAVEAKPHPSHVLHVPALPRPRNIELGRAALAEIRRGICGRVTAQD